MNNTQGLKLLWNKRVWKTINIQIKFMLLKKPAVTTFSVLFQCNVNFQLLFLIHQYHDPVYIVFVD